MKKIYLLTALILVSIFACTDKIIDLVVRINETFEYDTDANGDFTESYLVPVSDIRDNFEYDVEEVSKVNISFLKLEVNEKATNEATRIRLSGYYQEDPGSTLIPVFENYTFNISDFTSGPQAVSGYQAAGINALSNRIRDVINQVSFDDFVVSVTGTAVDSSGNPLDQAIDLEIWITLDAEVVFEEEVSLPNL
jgi:hypothetical protein